MGPKCADTPSQKYANTSGIDKYFSDFSTVLIVSTIMFKIFSMVLQIFLSPQRKRSMIQVKRSMIISNEHGIYQLLYELPNDLRLRITGNRKYYENLKTS